MSDRRESYTARYRREQGDTARDLPGGQQRRIARAVIIASVAFIGVLAWLVVELGADRDELLGYAGAALLFVGVPLVGASLMTLVASFTKSFKEAQTWVSVVLLAPTMPILIVSILQVRPSTALMFIPSLSQHLLLVGLVRNEPLNLLHVAVSVAGTLAVGALLTWICARLYRREGLLG